MNSHFQDRVSRINSKKILSMMLNLLPFQTTGKEVILTNQNYDKIMKLIYQNEKSFRPDGEIFTKYFNRLITLICRGESFKMT